MPWPKKNSYKEFDNEKKFPSLENGNKNYFELTGGSSYRGWNE